MIKLMLNLQKFNNYAFFCPVSRLHLTVSNPVGYTSEVTTAILKALKAKTVLDVDGVINIETGTVKAEKQVAPAQKPVEAAPEPKVSEQKNDNSKQEDAKVDNADEKAAKPKKDNKKTTKADTE